LAFGPSSVLGIVASGRAGSNAIVGCVQSRFIGNWQSLATGSAVDISGTAGRNAGQGAGLGWVLGVRVRSWSWGDGWSLRGLGSLWEGSSEGGKASNGKSSGELHFEIDLV